MANEITVKVYDGAAGSLITSGTCNRGAAFDISTPSSGLSVASHDIYVTCTDTANGYAESTRTLAGTVNVTAGVLSPEAVIGSGSIDDGAGTATQIQATGCSTAGTNRMLVATLTYQDSSALDMTGSVGVSGGGLTWSTPVVKYQSGAWGYTAVVSYAFASAQLTSQTITASWTATGSSNVNAHFAVTPFANASATIGNTITAGRDQAWDDSVVSLTIPGMAGTSYAVGVSLIDQNGTVLSGTTSLENYATPGGVGSYHRTFRSTAAGTATIGEQPPGGSYVAAAAVAIEIKAGP